MGRLSCHENHGHFDAWTERVLTVSANACLRGGVAGGADARQDPAADLLPVV
jgi:hypothetical protein